MGLNPKSAKSWSSEQKSEILSRISSSSQRWRTTSLAVNVSPMASNSASRLSIHRSMHPEGHSSRIHLRASSRVYLFPRSS